MKKIKIGDTVQIISGKEKGKTGKVQIIYHKKDKLLIKDINKKIKHIKPKVRGESGKIEKFDSPIHYSNVLVCDENGIKTRVGFTNSTKNKKRIAKKTRNLLL